MRSFRDWLSLLARPPACNGTASPLPSVFPIIVDVAAKLLEALAVPAPRVDDVSPWPAATGAAAETRDELRALGSLD